MIEVKSSKESKITKWRKRHKRCRHCKYIKKYDRSHLAYCKAKCITNIDPTKKRAGMFCPLFEAMEMEEE